FPKQLTSLFVKTHPFHILLIEDDDDDQMFFSEAVAEIDSSIKVTIFKDGINIIKSLSGLISKPDIIFLDINMPARSGFECLDDIRKHSEYHQVPVIMFSTSA